MKLMMTVKSLTVLDSGFLNGIPGNTKGGSITVPFTSCLTGLDESVLQIKTKISVVIQLIPNQSNRRSMEQ
jgi:hypothetical protein